MNDISLKLNERTMTGKKAAALRREGMVPSVVYGGKAEPIATQSPLVETTKVAHAAGKHSPVHLVIDGKKKLAIIKSIDIHPIKRSLRHVAFHTIKQNESIVTEVPIVLTGMGESPAEKAGLVILQALEHTEIKARPANLPESLEVPVASLETTDDKLTLADITLPEGVEFADAEQDLSLVVANVYEPSALQAANELAGGEAESEAEVTAENGGDTAQDSQAEESRPGGKQQDEPKQANVDANK
ncbi:MAG TPA: 50S ribosomal protein L25 [Candidatus Saccharimonadales bacterium]|nr:50S ribosomal protein L25 [Candidatus Saccharimonadales bacterium]